MRLNLGELLRFTQYKLGKSVTFVHMVDWQSAVLVYARILDLNCFDANFALKRRFTEDMPIPAVLLGEHIREVVSKQKEQS